MDEFTNVQKKEGQRQIPFMRVMLVLVVLLTAVVIVTVCGFGPDIMELFGR